MRNRARGPVVQTKVTRRRRTIVVAVLSTIWLLSGGRAGAGANPEGTVLDQTVPILIGHRIDLHSEVLGEDRTLLVSRPEGAIGHPLPVIIVLDGSFNFAHTSSTVDLLSRQGLIPPSLVVAVTNTVRERDFTAVPGASPLTGGADRFLEFIASELVGFLQQNFDVAPHRTIIGHSLGALLAVHAIVERPELFSAAIAISPALSNDERVPDGLAPLSSRAATAFASRARQPMTLFITVSDGEQRQWLEDLGTVLHVLERHTPEGFSWRLERMAGENHTSTVHRSVYDGLRWIHSDWNTDDLLADGDLDTVEARFNQVSARLGVRINPPESLLNRIGYQLLENGKVEEAIAVFERAVVLKPSSANTHDSLGEALERAGKLPGALRCYRRAVVAAEAADDPRTPIYRANLDRVEGRLLGDGGRE